jgi:hypothetical protein
MESTDKAVDKEQQLQLIYEMISAAKQEINENGFIFMMWGWLVFISCIVNFAGLYFGYPQAALVWLLMIAGGIITFIYYARQNKKEQLKNYIDVFLGYLWIAFGVTLFLVLFFQWKLGLSTYPMVMLIYGVGTFVTGGALKFRPLVFGGIWCWIMATAAFFVDFNLQLLLLALAVLGSYIIPGHLLRRKFNERLRSA